MRKFIILSIVGFITVTVLFTGCYGANLSQADIEQLVNDVMAANEEVKTCAFDMDVAATIEIAGGQNPVKTEMVGSGTGLADSSNRKMYLSLDTTVDIPDEGEQTIHMENYFINEWAYMKFTSPLIDSNWMKMRMPDEMWESKNQLEMQLQMFGNAQEVKYIGIEDIDGVSCHIVEITPDTKAMDAILSQVQIPEMEGVDFSEVNLTNMINHISYKVWIAKDSYLFMKVENHVAVELLPENFGATEADFEKITEDITSIVEFYDYDKPVSIEIPAEALEAPDFPGQLIK